MNKEISLSDAVARLEDGMTIGIGGWGPRRKPMALIREIVRSPLKGLTVVAFGGPDVGMLCAAGKVKKLVYGFVSLDFIPIEPFFRKAREAGGFESRELDEGMVVTGLEAAAQRLPFLPTRAGLGTDVMRINPELKLVASPYDDGEHLVAMPALHLDAALLHVNRADRLGNTQTDAPDPFFDALFARAARQCLVTAEEVTDRLDLAHSEHARRNLFERSLVSGVIAAPFGAHPTACHEAYGWDAGHFKTYCGFAAEANGWAAYRDEFIQADEAAYFAKVGGAAHVRALPLPVL